MTTRAKVSEEPRWVADRAALDELAGALAAAPAHAFDSESNSGFVYRERLCLLQFNVGGRLWLVDLVALGEGPDLIEPLREPLESPEVRTWVHGGEFDVGSMKRDFDLALGGIFDSQQAATFLGWEKTGYGAVVEQVCDVTLEKAYAHHDWSKRPISERALSYALDDVRYLPEVGAALEREVEAADLVGEVEVANETVMEAIWSPPSRREGIWRLKGIHKLDPRQLPRLVALWDWREAEAKRRDLPPGRLLHPELLLALARRPASREADLRAAGLRGRKMGYASEILDVLARAERKPPKVPKRPVAPPPSAGEGRRLKRLKRWRRTEADRRAVPLPVVLPPTAMQYLARHGCDDLDAVPQLGDKRRRLYGAELTRLCE